ncbi:MAG: beta-lactamase family protein, partial [Verrucomicrobiales bacterium]|nr:beta-lactamase family protein [Verrucomicrobiales bacterium]
GLVTTGLFIAMLGTNSFGGALSTDTAEHFGVDPSNAQGFNAPAVKSSQHDHSKWPQSVEHVTGIVRAIQASVARNPPSGDVAAPTEARDESAPSTILYRVIGELEALLDSREPGSLKAGARRHVNLAIGAISKSIALYGTSPRPAVALKSLAEAAVSLRAAKLAQHGRVNETLERASRELARAARGVAERLMDVAASAKAPQSVLEEARRLFALGDSAVANGNYAVAIPRFGAATDLTNGALTFDIARFEQNLRDKVEGKTIGHAYTIGLGGQLYSADHPYGYARTATDAPPTDQSPFKEMYTASMSKTLTAVGLLKALKAAGISVDSSIGPYLPAAWTQGQNVGSITFEHLLTHRSGLQNSGQTLDSLRDVIAAGTPGILPFNSADYTNGNFGLMRILIPQITTGADLIAIYSNVLPEDHVYAALYAEYISDEVLSPAAVNAPLCAPGEAASARTLGYLFSSPNSPGTDFGDWSLECGAKGWYLSVIELGSFLAFLRYTNDIVDFDTRALMDKGFLGWLNPVIYADYVAGKFGDYRAHGGDSHGIPVAGMTGCAMKFPTAVEATLLINSRGNNISGHACTVLRDAYDEAWTAP